MKTATTYTITTTRRWYGSPLTRSEWVANDGQPFCGTRAEALAMIAELDASIYYTSSGEAGRAEYKATRCK